MSFGHYIRDLVYANDGLMTTFAMVAGVTGGGLSARTIIIAGGAILFADGRRQLALDPVQEGARAAMTIPMARASNRCEPARQGPRIQRPFGELAEVHGTKTV